jgi:hypothetical protein
MAQLRRFTTGILPVVAFAACSQLIGLSEYEKGQEPNDNGGESSGGESATSGSSGSATGGRAGRGGTGGKSTGGTGAAPGGEGGDGGVGEGGREEGGASGSSTGGSRGGSAGKGGSGGKSTTGGSGGAGMAGGGAGGGGAGGGSAGGGMGGSAGGGTCTTVPVTLRGGNFDSDTSVWASYGEPSARTIVVAGASVSLTPNTEPNLAHFGQVDDWYAGHFQRIAIPAGAVTMTLTGYRYITTLETTTAGDYDDLGIQMWDDAVNPTEPGRVGTFVQLSNLDATDSWVAFSGTIAVSSRAGRTVDFDMWGSNDESNVSNFYVDSLVLTAFVCL